MPGVSIIMAVYRNFDTVTRAIESVTNSIASLEGSGCNQSPVELVAVLDGPDKKALKIIKQCQTNFPVRVVELPSHSGIAATRNAGVDAAQMPWITFLDGDDEFTPGRLLRLATVKHGQIFVGKQKLVWDARWQNDLSLPLDFIDRGEFHLSSMLLQRDVFVDLNGLSTDFVLGDDWDFSIRLKEKGVPLIFVEEEFVVRHVTGTNASINAPQLKADYFKSIRNHLSRRK